MNKLLVNLICCFIPKKKNREHFRNKYLNNCCVKTNISPHIRQFKNMGQTEISYIHECYWANIFRDTIQNSEWLLNKSFSPGRAALSYVSL